LPQGRRLMQRGAMARSRKRRCVEDSAELGSDDETLDEALKRPTRVMAALRESRQRWLQSGVPFQFGCQPPPPPQSFLKCEVATRSECVDTAMAAPLKSDVVASPRPRPVATRLESVGTTMPPLLRTDTSASPRPRPLSARLAARFDSAGMPAPSLFEGGAVPAPGHAESEEKEQPLNTERSTPNTELQQKQEPSIEDSMCAIMEETAMAHTESPRKRSLSAASSSQVMPHGGVAASRPSVSSGHVELEASACPVALPSSPRGCAKVNCLLGSTSQLFAATRDAEEELDRRRLLAALQILRMGNPRNHRHSRQTRLPLGVGRQSARLQSPQPGVNEASHFAPATPPPSTRGGPATSPSPVRSGLMSPIGSRRLLKRRKSSDESSEASSVLNEKGRSWKRSNCLRGLPRPELVELAGQLERRYA